MRSIDVPDRMYSKAAATTGTLPSRIIIIVLLCGRPSLCDHRDNYCAWRVGKQMANRVCLCCVQRSPRGNNMEINYLIPTNYSNVKVEVIIVVKKHVQNRLISNFQRSNNQKTEISLKTRYISIHSK